MYVVNMDNSIRQMDMDIKPEEILDMYESVAVWVVFRINGGKVQYAEPSTDGRTVVWVTAQRR